MSSATISTPRRPALAALRHPIFARYWFAVILSLSGLWMRIMVVGWLVDDLTHSPRLLGLVSFATAFPVLLLSPFAGLVADRFERRKVLFITQVLLGLVVASIAILTLTGVVQVWQLLIASAISGSVAAFDWPARLSLVPGLVPQEDLQNAVALNTAAFNAAGLIGPTIGGLVLPWFGPGVSLAIGALGFVPITIVLVRMRPVRQQARESDMAWRESLTQGFQYVLRHRDLSGLLLLELVPLVLGITYIVMMPLRAREFSDPLGIPSSRVLGWLMAAAAFGSLTGVLGVAGGIGRRARGRTMMIAAMAFGLVLIGFANVPWLPLAILLAAVAGFADATYATQNGTLVQTIVADAYRGRVMALYSLLWGLTPIGGLEAGELASRLGLRATLTINGAIVFCFVLAIGLIRPHLWRLK